MPLPPPEQWTVLETRKISGKGSIIPFASEDKIQRRLALFVTVARFPKAESINKKYTPNKGYYGTICALKSGYVIWTATIEFPRQRFTLPHDPTLLLQAMIPCVDQEIMQSIANLRGSFSFAPYVIENETKEWVMIDDSPDILQITCYADVGLSVSLSALGLDKCQELGDDQPPLEPPLPPSDSPPPGAIPPGDRFENSPPYEDNEDELYEPYPGDEIEPIDPPPDELDPQQEYKVTLRWYGQYGNEVTNDYFGFPPFDAFVDSGGNVYFCSRPAGTPIDTAPSCGPVGFSYAGGEVTVLSVTPV